MGRLGLKPISAALCEAFDGRMAFVPEGQADRSQARIAWVAMLRGLVPEGRLKSWSEIYGVHAALETLGIPLERYVGV
jgi:hypothetical protein